MGRAFSADTKRLIMLYKRKFETNALAQRELKKRGISVSIRGMQKIAQRVAKTRRYATGKQTGRPRKTIPREDRVLARMASRNRKMTVPELSTAASNVLGKQISEQLVRNRLHSAGYSRRVALRRPFITPVHKDNRLAFARAHVEKPDIWWHRIKFSDEKIFSGANDSARTFITRKTGERYEPECLVPTKRWGPQVHVWAIISWCGVGPIRRIAGTLTAEQYVTSMIPDIQDLCRERRSGRLVRYLFQQDNARPHVARRTLQFLQEEGVDTLPWPANSPDLNPIEHCWSYVSKRVRAHGTPRNSDQLWEWVRSEWEATPLDYVQSLYRSIRSRLRNVLEKNGGFGHY